MRATTYDKAKKVAAQHHGYVRTRTLKDNGVTDRQIASLVEEGVLEKISHGCFWHPEAGGEKPPFYQAIEVNMTNPKAVLCSYSAAYLHGLIDSVPEKLYYATAREDRHKMTLPYESRRYYYPQLHFEEGIQTIETPYGEYRIYDLDRTVCDCVRFRREVPTETLKALLERYREDPRQNSEALERYRRLILRNRPIFR
ncbi:MAG: type IV toxin-antitoxin system AbiEi family antitoxin domain-containing protein [Mogibacterium sp.]|nr:type IV toxin-antitoxin system AbiEi family antitoxin domain-containing protein [Mogibacterium sp.]